MTSTPFIKPIHPFPARMAPAIALAALPSRGRKLRVLDAMAGSGTTLVTARSRGHAAIGFDTDPLAVLIARAWSADFDPDNLNDTAETVLECARATYRDLPVGDAYPAGADEETRSFIRYWFDTRSRRQLTALSHSIKDIRTAGVRSLLWVAFSRMIITKAFGVSLAMDVSHSRPHRVYDRAPAAPFDVFLGQVRRIGKTAPFTDASDAPAVQMRKGDARRLPLDDHSVDLIITSPPYLNAIDYLRGHKLSLVWLGYSIADLRAIRGANIGTEVSTAQSLDDEKTFSRIAKRMCKVTQLSERHKGMLAQYLHDLNRMLRQTGRVLRRRGRAIFVVGNSTLRGTFIKNSEAIKALAQEHGMTVYRSTTRPLPDNRRYLPPPAAAANNTLHARMREEVIIEVRPS